MKNFIAGFALAATLFLAAEQAAKPKYEYDYQRHLAIVLGRETSKAEIALNWKWMDQIGLEARSRVALIDEIIVDECDRLSIPGEICGL
jgi:hypothetical protein